MITQVQPNVWSCVPTALAILLGVDLDKVLAAVGHDGSEILHPNLKDPFARRAFHMLEMTDAALKLGWALCGFEPFTFDHSATNDPDYAIEHSVTPYLDLLLKHNALLIGTINGNSHAVAFNAGRQLVYDPGTGSRYARDNFQIDAFYIPFRIGEIDRTTVC